MGSSALKIQSRGQSSVALALRFTAEDLERRRRSSDAYEKLFDPQSGSVSDKRGFCAALCFLLSSFLEQRHRANGRVPDVDRRTLRIATTALARHPLLDELRDNVFAEDDAPSKGSAETADFLRGALIIISFLDAALSWRPVDATGTFGRCEDCDGILTGQNIGVCSYAALVGRLRTILDKVKNKSKRAWHRLQLHLDLLRTRPLPAPWPWVWLYAQDASMLVRNKTRVPLRVELYRTIKPVGSPWADWPLLTAIMKRL